MPGTAPDSDELTRLIDALGHDLIAAAVHLRLYHDLRNSVAEYEREFNNANTFWQLTLNAHVQYSLHSLARAYDQHRSALSLRQWLERIRSNLHLFSQEQFRQRLRGNPFVDSLAEHVQPPDRTILDQDIAHCSRSNPLVERLVGIRNRVLAHRSSEYAAKGSSPYIDFPLTFAEIDELIDRAFTIYNRYNTLFRATSLSRQMVGYDDYRYVLEAIRRDRLHQQSLYQTQIDFEQPRRVT